jgi:uncharacterized protein (UPF0333 family)
MLTSAILSAVVLATGSVAQYYGGGNGGSSAVPIGYSSSAIDAAATQTWSSWPSSTSQPGTVMVQVVQVSNTNGSSLRYYPENIQAPPGSWVQFQFYPKVRFIGHWSPSSPLTCDFTEPHGDTIHVQQPLRPHP